jgi:hypothetical protein
MKIAEIDNEIKAKIIADREKDYGDYQYNFIMLAEMFTLVLADNLKKRIKPHQVGHIMMALKLYRSTRGYKADNYHDMVYTIIWHLNYTKKRLLKRIKYDKIYKNQKRRV